MNTYIYISQSIGQLDRVLGRTSGRRDDFWVDFWVFYEWFDGQSWSLQFDGEAVPCCRARHSKVSQSDCNPCTWHDECPTVCPPQLPPANNGRYRNRAM